MEGGALGVFGIVTARFLRELRGSIGVPRRLILEKGFRKIHKRCETIAFCFPSGLSLSVESFFDRCLHQSFRGSVDGPSGSLIDLDALFVEFARVFFRSWSFPSTEVPVWRSIANYFRGDVLRLVGLGPGFSPWTAHNRSCERFEGSQGELFLV